MPHRVPRKPKVAAAAGGEQLAKGYSDAGLDGGFMSMRDAYDEVGSSDAYYESHGATYRNPHELVMVEALQRGLTALEGLGQLDSGGALRTLDLAAGSGEATTALRDWAAR